jgi:hypothetical protein
MALRHLATRTTAVLAIGVMTVAVSGLGIADAANGGSLRLGHSNAATKTTTLKDSKGTPLSLVGKASKPPLKVNSKKLVSKLNAQFVGGKPVSQLASGVTSQLAVITDKIQDTTNQAGGVLLCPSGQHPLGGGMIPIGTADDAINVEATTPDVSKAGILDGWLGVIGDADGSLTAATPANGGGYAVIFVSCFSGSYTNPAASSAVRRADQSLRSSILRRGAANR